jgi:hypothetical protein
VVKVAFRCSAPKSKFPPKAGAKARPDARKAKLNNEREGEKVALLEASASVSHSNVPEGRRKFLHFVLIFLAIFSGRN